MAPRFFKNLWTLGSKHNLSLELAATDEQFSDIIAAKL
jgi:hypothetical protein